MGFPKHKKATEYIVLKDLCSAEGNLLRNVIHKLFGGADVADLMSTYDAGLDSSGHRVELLRFHVGSVSEIAVRQRIIVNDFRQRLLQLVAGNSRASVQ